jgi:5-methylcytosine-specific restriction endonuclease McrA
MNWNLIRQVSTVQTHRCSLRRCCAGVHAQISVDPVALKATFHFFHISVISDTLQPYVFPSKVIGCWRCSRRLLILAGYELLRYLPPTYATTWASLLELGISRPLLHLHHRAQYMRFVQYLLPPRPVRDADLVRCASEMTRDWHSNLGN